MARALSAKRTLGHVRLDVTSIYLGGLGTTELLAPVGRRRPPMMPIPGGRDT
jgi:hypothetical protein